MRKLFELLLMTSAMTFFFNAGPSAATHVDDYEPEKRLDVEDALKAAKKTYIECKQRYCLAQLRVLELTVPCDEMWARVIDAETADEKELVEKLEAARKECSDCRDSRDAANHRKKELRALLKKAEEEENEKFWAYMKGIRSRLEKEREEAEAKLRAYLAPVYPKIPEGPLNLEAPTLTLRPAPNQSLPPAPQHFYGVQSLLQPTQAQWLPPVLQQCLPPKSRPLNDQQIESLMKLANNANFTRHIMERKRNPLDNEGPDFVYCQSPFDRFSRPALGHISQSCCDKLFSDWWSLSKHILNHEKSYICAEKNCPEGFDHPRDYRMHQAQHRKSDERPGSTEVDQDLTCPQCSYSITEGAKVGYAKHLAMHKKQEELIIELCNQPIQGNGQPTTAETSVNPQPLLFGSPINFNSDLLYPPNGEGQ